MRRLVVAAVAIVALSTTPSGLAAQHGTLRLVSRQPLALEGGGFRPGESVHVVVRTSVIVSRDLHASRSGTFRVRFARVSVTQCGGVFAHARGRAGTVAALKIPLPACSPVAQP